MMGDASYPFALGVDGGGSKTLAVVVDVEGNERGRVAVGSSNHTGVGIERAVHNIYSAVEDAVRQAGCALPLRSAWFGLAGVDHPDDYDLLLPYLRPLAHSVYLTNDAELVLSGLPDAVGIALIAGTGVERRASEHFRATARDTRARATARVAPTIHGIVQANSYMVGATLAVALVYLRLPWKIRRERG